MRYGGSNGLSLGAGRGAGSMYRRVPTRFFGSGRRPDCAAEITLRIRRSAAGHSAGSSWCHGWGYSLTVRLGSGLGYNVKQAEGDAATEAPIGTNARSGSTEESGSLEQLREERQGRHPRSAVGGLVVSRALAIVVARLPLGE